MPFEIVPPGTHIDFIGKRRLAWSLSIAVLLVCVAAIFVNGVKLGIDFEGGTEMQVLFEDAVEVPAWDTISAGYVQTSQIFASHASYARSRGWPTDVLAWTHLHPLLEPGATAGAFILVVLALNL